MEIKKSFNKIQDALNLKYIILIFKQLNYLESLGCDSSCLIVNETKEVFVLGSSEGKNFLNSEPAIACKFQSDFGKYFHVCANCFNCSGNVI